MRPGVLAAVVLAAGLAGAAGARQELAAGADDWRAEFDRGVSAYEQGHAPQAEAMFADLLRRGHEHPAVAYNLGNAAYRQGRWALAVLAYEWALTLQPSDRQARDNLAMARSHLVADALPRDASPLALRVRESLARLPLRTSVAVLLAAWTAGWLLLGARWLSGNPAWTTPAIVLLLVAGLAAAHVAFLQVERGGPARGVVLWEEVEARSGPGDEYARLFTLHAGTLVLVPEQRGGWWRLQVPGGPSGWVVARSLGVIGVPDTLPRAPVAVVPSS